MSESESARIILFPSRPAACGPVAGSPQRSIEQGQAEARLTRALTGLNDAVTAQRAAVAAWKSSLGDLSAVTGRLGASLRSYNESLGHLDARVASLRTEAVKLEAWADEVIAKQV